MKIAARMRMHRRAAPVSISAFAPLLRPLCGIPVPLVLVGLVVEVRVGVLPGKRGSVSRGERSVSAQRT